MRGKLVLTGNGETELGLIPAHAGKTPSVVAPVLARRAHPRSRGENESRSRAGLMTRGSSPLMRGTLLGSLLRLGRHGLIPAHTGKTRACRAEPTSTRAHPRSRGENAVVSLEQLAPAGSSPLTRGKRLRTAARDGVQGLIPTHAGKTLPSLSVLALVRAHPRSRGENLSALIDGSGQRGSSPLTRGKPVVIRLGDDAKRAHPRSRGENIVVAIGALVAAGSSPLTRGKHVLCLGLGRVCGLIPAHAGKTERARRWVAAHRAHPRSRGENRDRSIRHY